jgi:cellulose synthase/poly-beta-1,6-N-acetylglucosamine synthase-like glycosyltransferase
MKGLSKKTYKVSVGIAALNEEKSIGAVLDSILSQKQNDWVLNEVLVYSDGSTDKTVFEARERDTNLVKTMDFKERKGKPFRCNQMLKVFKGDILVIFDADIEIVGKNVITNLIDKFRESSDIMLVGGNSRVYPPRNFFERAIQTSYHVYFKSREELKGGDNAFGCTGACVALRKEFAKDIQIPKWVISEDVYFYFSCLKAGYKFKYAPRAKVLYKTAGNLKDFMKQMFRSSSEAVNLRFKNHFGDLVNREYSRPKLFYIKSVLEVFLKNPLGSLYMMILKVLAKPFYFYFSKRYKLSWYTADSTKGGV